MNKKFRLVFIILNILLLSACGGGGGGGGSSSSSGGGASTPVTALTKVMDYQNEAGISAQVFNTQVGDLNGDGLQDIVVSGWVNEPASYTQTLNHKIPVKILIQQTDGTLADKTDALLGAGNNLIYGSQRILIADFDNDGKQDIFLGGFQDSPFKTSNCCTPVGSVMLWNNGQSFSRSDFADTVWAHAACNFDLRGTGRQDIVMGASSSAPAYNNSIYTNNGNRSFTLNRTLTTQYISSGGACSVMKDAGTGKIGIITTNLGYSALIKVYDSSFNYLTTAGLPGSEQVGTPSPAPHDIVNIVQMDLNGDGMLDLVLTDNKTGGNGSFVALINQGNFNFLNKTNDYFPTQTNNYLFGYFTSLFNIGGQKSFFVDNNNSAYNFSVTTIWRLISGAFSTYMAAETSAAIGSTYIQPSIYQTSSGSINLLLIKTNNGQNYTFYTKPL